MKALETFRPRNLEKRTKDLAIMQAKELADYDNFLQKFQKNLTAMKGKISNDPKEQLFIDLIKDCTIKTDQDKHPFRIFLYKNCDYMFEYNLKNSVLKNGNLWCSFYRTWIIFKQQYQMSYEYWQLFITNMIEKHFKFRPSTTLHL